MLYFGNFGCLESIQLLQKHALKSSSVRKLTVFRPACAKLMAVTRTAIFSIAKIISHQISTFYYKSKQIFKFLVALHIYIYIYLVESRLFLPKSVFTKIVKNFCVLPQHQRKEIFCVFWFNLGLVYKIFQ